MAQAAIREETINVANLLGGGKVFKKKRSSAFEMLEAVRAGLPYAALEKFQQMLDVRAKRLSLLLGVPPRTLARRKQSRQLNPPESDRLYRVAYVVGLAQAVLGTLDKAKLWLRRENRALGGPAPIDLLDTAIGVRQVEELLNRISHGIYS
jgi:putative toxin-antitoxin system antitoxin component (TIGR02293 family)